MITLKHILVATDFSDASQAAVVFARELARSFGSTLHVLHVAGSVVAGAIGVEGFTTNFAALQHEVEEAARRQIDTVITEEDRRTLAARGVVLTSSSPAQTIVSYAKDAHIDLLVVGTHGRGGLSHLVIGSVAERVVHTAPCPVLVVRPVAAESAAREATQVAAHA